MANTKSAQKAMRQAVRRAERNKAARSAVRTYVKKAGQAVTTPGDDVAETVRQAVRALDKAAQKGIIHRNAAARRKSRLMCRLHEVQTNATRAAAPAAATKAPSRRATAAAKSGGDKKSTTTRRTTSSTSRARKPKE
jgi:small subunit ribosomal protein S20